MKRSIKTALSAGLILALISVMVMGLAGCGAAPAAAAAAEASTVTVSASGTVKLVPDKATVYFGVTTREATAELAQSRNSEAVEKVMAVLTERGIDEKSIRTTNYSMYPQYDYSEMEMGSPSDFPSAAATASALARAASTAWINA